MTVQVYQFEVGDSLYKASNLVFEFNARVKVNHYSYWNRTLVIMIVSRVPLLLLSALPIIHSLQIPIPEDLEEVQSISPDEAEANIIQDNSVHDDLRHCELELADKSLGLAALHAQAKTLDKDLKECQSDMQTCKADLAESGVDLSAANAALHTCRSQGSDCNLVSSVNYKCLEEASKRQAGCRHRESVVVRGHGYLMLCRAMPYSNAVKTMQASSFGDCIDLCERNQPCVGVSYDYNLKSCLIAKFIAVSSYHPNSHMAVAARAN
jgi:hypothetical protein